MSVIQPSIYPSIYQRHTVPVSGPLRFGTPIPRMQRSLETWRKRTTTPNWHAFSLQSTKPVVLDLFAGLYNLIPNHPPHLSMHPSASSNHSYTNPSTSLIHPSIHASVYQSMHAGGASVHLCWVDGWKDGYLQTHLSSYFHLSHHPSIHPHHSSVHLSIHPAINIILPTLL